MRDKGWEGERGKEKGTDRNVEGRSWRSRPSTAHVAKMIAFESSVRRSTSGPHLIRTDFERKHFHLIVLVLIRNQKSSLNRNLHLLLSCLTSRTFFSPSSSPQGLRCMVSFSHTHSRSLAPSFLPLSWAVTWWLRVRHDVSSSSLPSFRSFTRLPFFFPSISNLTPSPSGKRRGRLVAGNRNETLLTEFQDRLPSGNPWRH